MTIPTAVVTHTPARLLLLGLLATFALVTPSQAATVGKVVYAKGVVTAQRPGENVRFLGRNTPLEEGDVLTTGAASFAVISLDDGTRTTLRPDTVLSIDSFAHGAGTESALMSLFKGGLRTITGLISKLNPDGYRISTATATIGIRGTDFDARLCEQDCADEAGALAAVTPPEVPVSGRVVFLRGTLSASFADRRPGRELANGAGVGAGEILETGARSYAVIVFRDDTRITLQPNTRFRIERYELAPAEPERESMVMRLLKGAVRTLTGAIATRRTASFTLATASATIGIRGTGFDTVCSSAAAADTAGAGEDCTELHVNTWKGEVAIEAGGETLVVGEDQTGALQQGRLSLVPLPDFMRDPEAPRPDSVPADLEQLFGAPGRGNEPGLYVLVRDGVVVLARADESVELAAGSAGYAPPAGLPMSRLPSAPAFMQQDRFPRPDQFDERSVNTIDLLRPGTGPEPALMCI